MSNPLEQARQKIRNLVFGLCILAAALLLLTTMKNIINSVGAEKWEVHQGTVISGSEAMGGFINPYSSASRWLQYKYEIDGREYRNTTIGYGINKPVSVLKAGDSVKVYVDPDNKATSVLAVGLVKGHFVGLLFSVGFVVLGFYLWRKV